MTRELTGTPRRVVSLNPSINEFLFLIGAGDRLVGVDVWSYRPREARRVARVGSFTGVDAGLVEAMEPDLVILYYPVQRSLVDPLSRIAPVLAVPTPVNLDSIVGTFRFVGSLMDLDEEADRIAGIYVELLRDGLDVEDALVVMYLGGYDFACSGSYIASILRRLGASYVRLRCIMKFLGTDEEATALLNEVDPGFIIYEGRTKQFREVELGFTRVSRCRACVEGRILVTPNDTLAHYGPSLPLDMALVAEALRGGSRFVQGVSSVRLPPLSDAWYSRYR